jgi:hypothetical protein
MQIVFHIGANATDADRLVRTLMRDGDALSGQGVAVPDPNLYRKLMQGAVAGLSEATAAGSAAPDAREVIVRELLGGQEVRRVVMSNSAFLAWPRWVIARGILYPRAATKVAALGQIFPQDEIELFLALRNPATFIPAIWRLADTSWDDLLSGLDPLSLQWSDVVARLRRALPRARFCVWCNEDSPFVWGTVLRRMAGLGPDVAVAGEFDLLAGVITAEGMERFLGYLQAHPGQSELQIRRVIGAFLGKFAIPEAVEEVVDAPDWDETLVAEITRAYDEDVARIAKMPGVDFIAP